MQQLLGCFFRRLNFLDENDVVNEKVMIEAFTPIFGSQEAAEKKIKPCVTKNVSNEDNLSLSLYKCYREIFPKQNKH